MFMLPEAVDVLSILLVGAYYSYLIAQSCDDCLAGCRRDQRVWSGDASPRPRNRARARRSLWQGRDCELYSALDAHVQGNLRGEIFPWLFDPSQLWYTTIVVSRVGDLGLTRILRKAAP